MRKLPAITIAMFALSLCIYGFSMQTQDTHTTQDSADSSYIQTSSEPSRLLPNQDIADTPTTDEPLPAKEVPIKDVVTPAKEAVTPTN